jgi:hypothetical protein
VKQAASLHRRPHPEACGGIRPEHPSPYAMVRRTARWRLWPCLPLRRPRQQQGADGRRRHQPEAADSVVDHCNQDSAACARRLPCPGRRWLQPLRQRLACIYGVCNETIFPEPVPEDEAALAWPGQRCSSPASHSGNIRPALWFAAMAVTGLAERSRADNIARETKSGALPRRVETPRKSLKTPQLRSARS